MRRTSQSTYQPSNKSVLGQSKFNGALEGSAFMGSKGFMAQSQRKIQGQDLGHTTKTNFQETVNKLKSKPNKKVLQDEYIKGLQQQIKYLEYELKLLKDKQILEREGVNQLDNFLKDEIPINENILAMKNKYKATKAKLEEQFSNLSGKNMISADVLQTQKKQIQRLHQIINQHRKQVDERRAQFKDKLSETVREITLTETQYQVLWENNRSFQQKIKKMNQQISTIQRANQKEKIEEVRANQEKSKKIQKFEENNKKTKESLFEALQKVEQIEAHNKQKGTNPLSDEMQQKNSVLRKQIMVNEKQKSTAQNVIAEINLFLQEQKRQRQIQRKQKLKITNIIDENRAQLQNLQRNSENMIKQQTLRAKKIIMRQMTHDLQEKQEIYQKLKDRLEILEGEASSLISDKKDLQNTLENQQGKERAFNKKIQQLQKTILINKCSVQSLNRVRKQIIEQTLPLKSDLDKFTGRVPNVQKEIQKRNSMIHYLNKQVDLLKELKSLDLDHLQMVSTSGMEMQNTLNNFIKNWEKLKSL